MSEDAVSRRDFLRLGLAAGAAASLGALGVAGGADAGPASGGDRLRCGFIGVGGRGSRLLEETLGLGTVEVLAICDIDPSRLGNAIAVVKKAQGRTPRGYGEDGDKHAYRRLLARRDLNAVVLATPCHWHAPMYLDAIAAGKHFYGEKPMCISVKEANDIVAAAERAPRLIAQIGFQRRADPSYIEAVRLIHQGEIGELLEGRVAWSNAWGPLVGWFSHRTESGDWVIEQACHTWDVLNWVAGATPLRAFAIARSDIYSANDPGRDVADYYAAIIEYPKRFVVSAFHTWISPDDGAFAGVYERVVGRQGGCVLGEGRFVYREKGKPERAVGAEVNDTRESLRAFFDSIRTGTPPVSGVRNGRDAVLVGLMIRHAYDSGRVVTWEDTLRLA
jgi:predicted dehydrogenase